MNVELYGIYLIAGLAIKFFMEIVNQHRGSGVMLSSSIIGNKIIGAFKINDGDKINTENYS